MLVTEMGYVPLDFQTLVQDVYVNARCMGAGLDTAFRSMQLVAAETWDAMERLRRSLG